MASRVFREPLSSAGSRPLRRALPVTDGKGLSFRPFHGITGLSMKLIVAIPD